MHFTWILLLCIFAVVAVIVVSMIFSAPLILFFIEVIALFTLDVWLIVRELKPIFQRR